ncbi:MAG TPA: hypothetical protein VN048_11345, partial [Verrucomicrobiae bacterium]|nr:hypothetical protein [Verrucomicrobiae bacterium]
MHFRVTSAIALFLFLAAPLHAADAAPPAPMTYHADWRWVKGAVFVPTKYVNEAQQWDQYDPAI